VNTPKTAERKNSEVTRQRSGSGNIAIRFRAVDRKRWMKTVPLMDKLESHKLFSVADGRGSGIVTTSCDYCGMAEVSKF
jgi:hypothetical protein